MVQHPNVRASGVPCCSNVCSPPTGLACHLPGEGSVKLCMLHMRTAQRDGPPGIGEKTAGCQEPHTEATHDVARNIHGRPWFGQLTAARGVHTAVPAARGWRRG
jgi:hypothetical protein